MAMTLEIAGRALAWAWLGRGELDAAGESWMRGLGNPALSRDPTFRSYIEDFSALPAGEAAWATGLVVAALHNPPRLVTIEREGDTLEVVVPPGYAGSAVTRTDVMEAIKAALSGGDARAPRLESADAVPAKHLATWAGLAGYGRNNITYVPGMGTAAWLLCFWTDLPERDVPEGARIGHPGENGTRSFLDACGDCGICVASCPTGAIPVDGGCIDAGRCISLYNELEGEFPGWIPKSAHNAAFGCLRCQEHCPANAAFRETVVRPSPLALTDLELILQGEATEEARAAVGRVVACDKPEVLDAYLPILRRNLGVLARKKGAAR